MFESVYYKFPLFFRHTVYTPLSTKIVRHHQGHGKAVLNNRCSGNFREKQANATVDVTLSRDRATCVPLSILVQQSFHGNAEVSEQRRPSD